MFANHDPEILEKAYRSCQSAEEKIHDFVVRVSRITDRSARVAEQVVEEAKQLLKELREES